MYVFMLYGTSVISSLLCHFVIQRPLPGLTLRLTHVLIMHVQACRQEECRGVHVHPPFQIEIYKQWYATVCKVVSSRQSPTKLKVVGHPLASMMQVFEH